ncbi:MAG: thymidine phosphorylase [Bifidobacteriaceae bacterium]|jgi:pyrimidine-nucleoside phosphorylase|nr:thymidine phosphorylase [Bifidobacteriaceae bacterium]
MVTMYEIIEKKQRGNKLDESEIKYFVNGYTAGDIPDYQASALLMAIYFVGMDYEETALLTRYMTNSGEIIDLSGIDGIKIDKHSTGGVGDKATIVTVPLAAACGENVAKFSGRGLGFTGGTIDKLESIPGYVTGLSIDKFIDAVNKVGAAMAGATGDLAPADKKLYALRDVTSTVESIPLIASSIMSKKLASGADGIILDVKCGSGAFMKNPDTAAELAQTMIDIGKYEGKDMAAFITNMDQPLGLAIGNALEIKEAVETLQGNGPADLVDLCVSQCVKAMEMTSSKSADECKTIIETAINDGSAYKKFLEIVENQGGDTSYIEDISKLVGTPSSQEWLAENDGYISSMQTERIGISSVLLGAGRETKEDDIDYLAGIVLAKKTGDIVKKGDLIATAYATDSSKFDAAKKCFMDALTFSSDKPEIIPIIIKEL